MAVVAMRGGAVSSASVRMVVGELIFGREAGEQRTGERMEAGSSLAVVSSTASRSTAGRSIMPRSSPALWASRREAVTLGASKPLAPSERWLRVTLSSSTTRDKKRSPNWLQSGGGGSGSGERLSRRRGESGGGLHRDPSVGCTRACWSEGDGGEGSGEGTDEGSGEGSGVERVGGLQSTGGGNERHGFAALPVVFSAATFSTACSQNWLSPLTFRSGARTKPLISANAELAKAFCAIAAISATSDSRHAGQRSAFGGDNDRAGGVRGVDTAEGVSLPSASPLVLGALASGSGRRSGMPPVSNFSWRDKPGGSRGGRWSAEASGSGGGGAGGVDIGGAGGVGRGGAAGDGVGGGRALMEVDGASGGRAFPLFSVRFSLAFGARDVAQCSQVLVA